jgi:hypothetical protein
VKCINITIAGGGVFCIGSQVYFTKVVTKHNKGKEGNDIECASDCLFKSDTCTCSGCKSQSAFY